jgi:hypothetical protein
MSKGLFKRLSVWGIVFLLISGAAWSDVPWTIVPITSTTISLPSNVTATVSYRVTNVSGEPRTFAMKPIAGVTQTITGASVCSNPFTLGDNGSCILTLVIPGSGLTAPITNGPEVCIADSNGQPDSQMCYQPASQSASLNITPGAAAVLGQSLGGGTVACLGGAPYLNLIAATTDISTGIRWGIDGNVPNAENADDGATNTANIVNCLSNSSGTGCPPAGGSVATTTYAAGLCSDYTGGGYTDWFLPAKNQLNCLYTNKDVVGDFSTAFYWSSTEANAFDTFVAWIQLFFNGGQSFSNKSDTEGVRCVRALTL